MSTARQTLLKWQESGSTVLVRLDITEASTIVLGTIQGVLNDLVILEVAKGTLRISLIGNAFESEPKFGPESFIVRYSSGHCIFIGFGSKQEDEWPEIISGFDQ